jgi:flagellar motor protein MotB
MAEKFQDEEEFNIWPTYADVSFAVLLLMIFVMLGQYIVIGKILEINKNAKEQELLSEKLKRTFPVEYGESIHDFSEPQLQMITFTDKILFDTGSDALKSEGKAVLEKVAAIINELKHRHSFDEIQVRGHTDDRPISGFHRRFPTNWELSSARATSVVRFFVDECGLRPTKELLLSAQGYAEYDPVRDNIDDEARALNRRIEIVIKYPVRM